MEQPEKPSASQGDALLGIIESTFQIQTSDQFLAWTEGELQTILPHEILICGIGQINRRSIRIQKSLFKRFPMQYLEDIRQTDKGIQSPVMARWCQERKPQLFEADVADSQVDSDWLRLFQSHDLRNIAAHGMHDLSSNVTSYFSFLRIPEPLTARHSRLLELLVPHMHVALTRVLADVKPARDVAQSGVTAREREILGWLQHGKSNWEIAQIFGRSENTVKHQVRGILVKLRVNNRIHAVSRALELKILG